MQLSVIIVSYQVRRYLYQCLRSVEDATRGLEADIWVVDNLSQDDTLAVLPDLFPKVHFIRNDENVGFSKANNKAIRLSRGRFVLLLNPDTFVTTASIRDSLAWMKEHDDAGAVGVAMHNAYGDFAWESRRGIPTPLVSFCKMSGLSKLFPRHHVMGRYYMRFLDRQKPSRIEILSGAYMMLRREALDQVGLLDEDFFMYGEDIDLSYRLLKGGWHNYYLPHPIIHYKGESEHPSTVRYVNVFHQAMIIFYEKHFQNRYFLSGLLIRLAVYAKAFLTLLKHAFGRCLNLFSRNKVDVMFYCYAAPENRTNIEQQAADMGMKVRFLALDEQPNAAGKNDSMLFDVTLLGYDEIIRRTILQSIPNHRLFVSTYDPQNGILIP